MKRLHLSSALAVLSLSIIMQPMTASASAGYGGGYGYGNPCCGTGYTYPTPCCTQPQYPWSSSSLYTNSLNAYNNLYDFDTLFANKAQKSEVDKLNKFDASSRNIEANKINRVSDKLVDIDHQDFAKYDQWKNVEIIRVNEGVSKSAASKDSKKIRDLDVINDSHYSDKAANVSSLDKAHAAQAAQSSQGATSVNQNANALNTNTTNQTQNSGYSY